MQQITRKIIPPPSFFSAFVFLDPEFQSVCSVLVNWCGHPEVVLHTDVHVEERGAEYC